MRGLIEGGQVTPNYAPSQPFKLEIPPPPGGIIKGLIFDFRGTNVGVSVNVADDAPFTMIQDLKVEFRRHFGEPLIFQSTGRDAMLISDHLLQNTSERLAPTAATAISGVIYWPLELDMMAAHRWGIDPAELTGSIIVTGRWAALAAYATTPPTAITAGILTVTLDVEDDEGDEGDVGRFALLPVTSLVDISADSANIRDTLSTANLHGAFGVFFRQFDSSAAALNRVDGIVKRLKLDHGDEGEVLNAFFKAVQAVGWKFWRVPNGEALAAKPNGFAGTAFFVAHRPSPILAANGYINLVDTSLAIVADTLTAAQVGVTDVTPAASDELAVTIVGVQGNAVIEAAMGA